MEGREGEWRQAGKATRRMTHTKKDRWSATQPQCTHLPLSPHLGAHELCHVPYPRRELSLWATVVPFRLFDLNQLLIQSLLLKKQLLGLTRLNPKFLLQGQNHTVLPSDLVHLPKRKNQPSISGPMTREISPSLA